MAGLLGSVASEPEDYPPYVETNRILPLLFDAVMAHNDEWAGQLPF